MKIEGITKNDFESISRCELRTVNSSNGEDHEIWLLHDGTPNTIIYLPIYRYTSIFNILSILDSNRLYVSNRSLFSDHREKGEVCSFNEIKSKFREISNCSMKLNERLDDTSGLEWQQHISCWTSGVEKGEDEDYLMWSSYAGKAGIFACRIKSTISDFADSVFDLPADMLISNVSYINLEKPHVDSFRSRFFEKANFYRSEREVRFAFLSNSKEKHIYIGVKSSFIKEIMLSPFASKEQNLFMQDYLCHKYPIFKDIIKLPKVIEY